MQKNFSFEYIDIQQRKIDIQQRKLALPWISFLEQENLSSTSNRKFNLIDTREEKRKNQLQNRVEESIPS